MTSSSTPPFTPRVRAPGSTLVVAIDGPAASGKSSTARWVAERVGFHHIDSGSLYRAATAMALRSLGDPVAWTEERVLEASRGVRLARRGTTFIPEWSGTPLDQEIRGSAVTQQVSRVAQMPAVRRWVNEQVRLTARGTNVVVDGRDMGTAVFPDADLKVFLVADPWERARRRLIQRLARAPLDEEIAEETERLVQRDARDATQTLQAKDAVLLDTTYLTQPEQVERIVALVRVAVGREKDSPPG